MDFFVGRRPGKRSLSFFFFFLFFYLGYQIPAYFTFAIHAIASQLDNKFFELKNWLETIGS